MPRRAATVIFQINPSTLCEELLNHSASSVQIKIWEDFPSCMQGGFKGLYFQSLFSNICLKTHLWWKCRSSFPTSLFPIAFHSAKKKTPSLIYPESSPGSKNDSGIKQRNNLKFGSGVDKASNSNHSVINFVSQLVSNSLFSVKLQEDLLELSADNLKLFLIIGYYSLFSIQCRRSLKNRVMLL